MTDSTTTLDDPGAAVDRECMSCRGSGERPADGVDSMGLPRWGAEEDGNRDRRCRRCNGTGRMSALATEEINLVYARAADLAEARLDDQRPSTRYSWRMFIDRVRSDHYPEELAQVIPAGIWQEAKREANAKQGGSDDVDDPNFTEVVEIIAERLYDRHYRFSQGHGYGRSLAEREQIRLEWNGPEEEAPKALNDPQCVWMREARELLEEVATLTGKH